MGLANRGGAVALPYGMYGSRTRPLALHQKESGLANRGGAVALPYGMYGSRTRFLALHQKEWGLANRGGAIKNCNTSNCCEQLMAF